MVNMVNLHVKRSFLVACGLVSAVFAIALLRIHVRVQTTVIGYELGQLKNQEKALLEHKSQLQMQLAKLTSKNHLSLMVSDNNEGFAEERSLAAK